MLLFNIKMFSRFVFITLCELSEHSAIVGCVITGDVTNLQMAIRDVKMGLDLWTDLLCEQYRDEDRF
jgi:hypothetical protein